MPREEELPPSKRVQELKNELNDSIERKKHEPYIEKVIDFLLFKIVEIESKLNELSEK